MYTQTEEILPSSVSAIKVHSDEKINPAAAKAAPVLAPVSVAQTALQKTKTNKKHCLLFLFYSETFAFCRVRC